MSNPPPFSPPVSPTMPPPPASAPGAWLNRDVVGMAITSFLSDACHEMVTAILPGFLQSIAAPIASLGWIEGGADATSSFLRLGSGWLSDRIGHRKRLVAAGYSLTSLALASLAFALSWPLVLAGRTVAWFGRGFRSPLRKAMLAEAVPPQSRGRAFGLHGAADTLGAVLGPLAGVWLIARLPRLTPSGPFRTIFLLSLIPGLAAVAAFVILVRERAHPAQRQLRLRRAVQDLPHSFFRFLRGVGVFGLGDFSHSLLILAATELLTPSRGAMGAIEIAGLFYVLHNLVQALATYPLGMLADRGHKIGILLSGYAMGVATAAGLAVLLAVHSGSLAWLGLEFALAGLYVAAQETEGVIAADLVPAPARATGYGLLGTVNGVGDLVSSALVGSLWALSAPLAFATAAALMLAGALALAWTNRRPLLPVPKAAH